MQGTCFTHTLTVAGLPMLARTRQRRSVQACCGGDSMLQQPTQRRSILMAVPLSQVLMYPATAMSGTQPAAPQASPQGTPASTAQPPSSGLLQQSPCLTGSFTYRSNLCGTTDDPPPPVAQQQQAGAGASGRSRQRVAAVSTPTSCSQGVGVTMRMYLPPGDSSPAPPPVVVLFSPGFLVQSQAYDSYLDAALQQGWGAVTYDVQQSALDALDDVDATLVHDQVMAWGVAQLRMRHPSSQPVNLLLAGHSRGAKLSCLAAQQLQGSATQQLPGPQEASPAPALMTAGGGAVRVVGLFLMDPADGSFETTEGPRFPSAATSPALLPMMIIGAGRNADCIPRRANYNKFWASARPPSMLIEVKTAGHFAFLDYQTALQQAVCGDGSADPEAVKAVSRATLQLWGQWCVAAAGGQQQERAAALQLGVVGQRLQQMCDEAGLLADVVVSSGTQT